MSAIKFGNEVYTWFMSGDKYNNKLDHMIEISAKAGLTGIEPMSFWLGDFADADKLASTLKAHNMELAGIALVENWDFPEETEEEKKRADDIIELLLKFPGALLCTVQMPQGRHDLEQRRKNLVSCVNAVSTRAAAKGIKCSFHPNSPDTSINRTEEDYAAIIPNLDSSVTGWTPDVGHIANGKMDPLTKMKEFQSLINHVHYKDMSADHKWAAMGEGIIDFKGITQFLVDIGYEGWIIGEDEAEAAEKDPDAVTLQDGVYFKEHLAPIVEAKPVTT